MSRRARPRSARSATLRDVAPPHPGAPGASPLPTAQPGLVEVSHYTDAACPWAYNFEPALRALEARYGDQLNVPHGHDRALGDVRGVRSARLQRRGRVALAPPLPLARHADGHGSAHAPVRHRPRVPARQGGRAAGRAAGRGRCCARCASRWFTTDLVMDEDEALRAVAESIEGLDAERALADARDARGRGRPTSATAQSRARPSGFAVTLGRTAASDGPDRYTAPSLVLRADGRRARRPGLPAVRGRSTSSSSTSRRRLERLPVPSASRPAGGLPRRPDDRRGRARARRHDHRSRPRRRPRTRSSALSVAGGARRRSLGHDALWTAV